MSDGYIRNLLFKPNTVVGQYGYPGLTLTYCIFYKRISPSYHQKLICWNILLWYLKSTLLPSNNSVQQNFSCCKFELRLLNLSSLFANFIILLACDILYRKIPLSWLQLQKNMFHVQRCQFLSIPSDNRGFVDIFLSEFSFQNLFWFLLIELSLCKSQKP